MSTRAMTEGIVLGALYGLFFRIAIATKLMERLGAPGNQYVPAMTLAFLALGPCVLGFLCIRRIAKTRTLEVWHWIFIPWISVLIFSLGTVVLFIEGSICVIFALPLAFAVSSIGGVIAGLLSRSKMTSRGTTVCIALLPLILAPAETMLPGTTQTRSVVSEIRIHAPTETVWRNVARVSAIAPSELRPSWAHAIGFPRPVEATLSFEGVGGVRHATFEHGLLFIETVTEWQPQQRIAFSIKADTEHIPSTTLDEHVSIGGRYFDVLDGEYRLERLAGGDILLHLTSHQRLSTDFNNYAGFWTDAVMQNLQTSILEVIKHRCEDAPSRQP
jgi:uncharacterized protein YndB with AHSA1/START domain